MKTDRRRLAEWLVRLNLALEDLEGRATSPEEVVELGRLEALRDEVEAAIASGDVPAGLREELHRFDPRFQPAPFDARE